VSVPLTSARVPQGWLPRRTAVVVFLVFAFTYFLSALMRAITATLAPTFVEAFSLDAAELGLLAGAYFLGFSITQLPLGAWLDRHGPRRVQLAFLVLAIAGCIAFAYASDFWGLWLARALIGVGVGSCLMAPMTAFRGWLSPPSQLRANSWMLMTGSLGMVASTLPVQWLLPLVGWRAIFVLVAVLFAVSMALTALLVPTWPRSGQEGAVQAPGSGAEPRLGPRAAPYREIFGHPYFRRVAVVGFFHYGGFVAIQTLWAGPWLVRVCGWTPAQAAAGMFWLNVGMLCTFFTWGVLMPRLLVRGWTPVRLVRVGVPTSLCVLAVCVALGPAATVWALALFCITSTSVSSAHPSVALAFPPELAGRALSAYNLLVFLGVFVVQWGIGVAVEGFQDIGWTEVNAFRGAWGLFGLGCVASYLLFLRNRAEVPMRPDIRAGAT